MPTIEVTDDTFQAEVLEAQGPVLVDFWATWCAPCRAVAPVLEALSTEYAGKITIAKVDVDRSPKTAQRYGIRSIPTLALFEGGKAITAAQGALPKPAIIELLEKHVSSLKPPTIKVDELAALLSAGEGVHVIDIRAAGDHSRSHLRGSRQLDPTSLATELDALTAAGAKPDDLVVLICRTGADSSKLVAELGGGRRVLALAGGILEWEGSGRPTYSDREEAELASGA